MFSWIANSWENFSLWITNQPTFVEVACGIGLFYVALQLLKLLFKLFAFLFAPLMETSVRFTKRKDRRTGPHKQKKPPPDDDSPPFVFR